LFLLTNTDSFPTREKVVGMDQIGLTEDQFSQIIRRTAGTLLCGLTVPAISAIT